VPRVFAGVGVERDDGRNEQVVAAAGAAGFLRPREAVAGAEIDEVGFGVVDDGVPDRRAAAELPVLVTVPCLRGFDEFGLFVGLGWITGDRVPGPQLLAGLGVEGGDAAADVVFGAAVADEDFPVGDARRAGDGVVCAFRHGLHRPDFLAGLAVERDQAAVERAENDLALPRGDAAVDHVTAGVAALGAVDLGIVLPERGAGADVVGLHHAPCGGEIHDAVDDDGRRFLTALGVDVGIPGEAES